MPSAEPSKPRDRRAMRSQTLLHPVEAYTGVYRSPTWGTLELRRSGERLVATMGVARSPAEVYDASKEMLRVELFGGGEVMKAVFPSGAARAEEIRFRGSSFPRVAP